MKKSFLYATAIFSALCLNGGNAEANKATAPKGSEKAAPAKPKDTKAKEATDMSTAEFLQALQASGNPVVAKVGDKSFRVEDVIGAMQNLPAPIKKAIQEGSIPLPLVFEGSRDQLIDFYVLSEAAKKAEKDLKKDLEVQEEIKQAVEQVLLNAYLREIRNKITDADLKKRYKEVVSKIDKNEKSVGFRFIVLKTEAEAKEIIKQLDNKVDFLKLARENSLDKETAAKGGDLGNAYRKKDMPAEIANTIFKKDSFDLALKPGEYTKKPVKIGSLFFVIKVDTAAKYHPPKYAQMKGNIKAQLTQEAMKKHTEALKKKIKVERFDAINGKPVKAFSKTVEDLMKKKNASSALKKK